MKAVILSGSGGPEVLSIGEIPEPSVSAHEILVRVRATALNRADILQRKGFYPAPPGVRQEIPGLEFAGEVEATGPKAGLFKPGDRVMGIVPGEAHAEKVVLLERLAMPVPDTLNFEEAAAIPEVFLTAWDALSHRLRLKTGESLLIHAVGSGVGTAALQLGNLLGATLLGTSRSVEKLHKASAMGLHVAIHPQTEDLRKIVLERTQGRGCDAVLDLVGSAYWDRNLECLAVLGRMVVVGLTGGSKVQADLSILLRKRLRIIGTVLRARVMEEKAALVQDFARHILPFFVSGRLRPIIDRVFDLDEIGQAHTYMEENRNFGKIVLQI